MNTDIKTIWRIIRKKKSERSIREDLVLHGWLFDTLVTPFRIILFPIILLVKAYKWTYDIK